MWDEIYYDNIAHNVLNGKLYTQFIQTQGTLPPGYSIFISVAYLFSGDKNIIYHLMLVINAILTTSIIFPSYFILKKYCSKELSVLGSLMVTLLPSVGLYMFQLMSESLFIPLFAFSVWFLLESFETNKASWQILAGLSIGYLYITRSTGIAMLTGLAIAFLYYILVNLKNANLVVLIKDKAILISTTILVFIAWVVYSIKFIPYSVPAGTSIGTSQGTPYVNEPFTTLILETISQLHITIIINELDYILLTMYAVFAFLMIYTCIDLFANNDKRKSPLSISFIYFISSSIGLMFITIWALCVAKMLGPYADITMYGRYIEPMIPVAFIFSIIGLDTLYNKIVRPGIKEAIILTILVVSAAILLITTVSNKIYKYPDTNSLYYIQSIHTVPVYIYIGALLLITAILFYLSFYHKILKMVFIIFIICSSIYISIPVYNLDLYCTNYYDGSSQIGRVLNNDTTDNVSVMMDSDDLQNWDGMILLGETTFWAKKSIIIANITGLTNFSNSVKKSNYYLISSKFLDYQTICSTNGPNTYSFHMYDLSKQYNVTKNPPYTIGMGDSNIQLDGFWYPEGDNRWTSGDSKVLIDYAATNGDMKITVYTLGYRPADDPATIGFYVNGVKICENVKKDGSFVYSFTVSKNYLNPDIQILEIKTNTWKPANYGLSDSRDLGIMVNHINIDKQIG